MIQKINLKNKKLIGITSVIAVLAGALIARNGPFGNEKRDLTGFTTFAESGALPGLITASGELQSVETVNVSPKRQGILEKVYVKAGDKVSKGQLIASMDSGDMSFRLDELKAEFKKQKAIYIRRELLFKEGAISRERFEEFENSFIKSKAKLNQLKVENKDLKILAPFEGTITSKYAVAGAYVTPSRTSPSTSNTNQISTSIVELSRGLEVIANVPESDIGRIKVGQVANVRVDSFPEKIFKARVEEIAPRAVKSNNVTSFEVTLLLEKISPILRIGMTADIEFVTGERSINILVPTVAIVTKNGLPGLLFVSEDKQPIFKKVELGISSGSKTSIIKGANPGDQIFIDIPPWSKQINN